MKVKRFLRAIPLTLVLLAIVAVPVFAWAKGGNIDCDEVMVRIRNDSGSHTTRYYQGWVKVDGVIVYQDSGWVSWNHWATISWDPPVGTSGNVQAYVVIRNNPWSSILDSHTVRGSLDCQPDYQLNLSHIECSQQGSGGYYVEVHFVLLNVPDGITPGDFVDFTDGVNLWQAPRGAHTGNVWHYTAYLPDGYYNITAATVDVDGYTVTLHNPGDYAGDYFCTPLTHDYTVAPNDDCSIWAYTLTVPEPTTSITLVSGATSGVWALPFVLENNAGQEPTWHVVWADGYEQDVSGATISEDGQCQQVHQVSYGGDPDCGGATAFYQIDGGAPIPYFTYGWANPYVLEDVDAPAFDIPVNPGELYSITTIPAQHFDEPLNCLVVLNHDFDTLGDVDCDDWSFSVTVYEGGWYTTQDALAGIWTDAYSLESASGTVHLEWPDGYTLDIPFTLNEPSTCLYTKDWDVSLENDCVDWALAFDIAGGGQLVLDEGVELAGTWQDPHTLEAVLVTGKIVWLDQTEDLFSYVVSEPQECFVCEITPLYRMVRLVDYDAPDWYYGEGADNGSCWVIMHEDGTFPSVGRQADVCSVCVHPDFIFRADRVAYDAYVTIDCNGRISYPDPLWRTEWFRPDYDSICRQPSCIEE